MSVTKKVSRKSIDSNKAVEASPSSERRPKTAGGDAPAHEEAARDSREPWERIGLPAVDHHNLDSHNYIEKLSIAELFSAFLVSYDDDPIAAGMLALAADLDALTTTAGDAAPDSPVCLADGAVAHCIHRAAARLRVLAELHRRAMTQ